MSVRNWTFIAQQTPVLLLLAFAQLLVVTTDSIDISVGSNLLLAPTWPPWNALVRRVGFSGWNIFGRFHWCTEWDDLLTFQNLLFCNHVGDAHYRSGCSRDCVRWPFHLCK